MNISSINNINELLFKFAPINLEQMDEVSFFKRTDTKYVFHQKYLIELLKEMPDYYRLLKINESGIQTYSTTYYDTLKFDMYHQHHNGLRKRYKVRTRNYLNSNQLFLEVKVKNNKGITSKKRIELENPNLFQLQEDSNFLKKRTPFLPVNLTETLRNGFFRITLVNLNNPERITIDWQLSYENLKNGSGIEMEHVCVLEIKRSLNTKNNVLDELLKKHQIYPGKFSKYCIGVAQLEPNLKNNRFKSVFHQLRKKEIIN